MSKGKKAKAPQKVKDQKSAKTSGAQVQKPEPRAKLIEQALRADAKAQLLAAQAEIILPPRHAVADGWRFDASSSPVTLAFDLEGEALATLPLDERTYGELLGALNGAYIIQDDEPLNYQVRVPDLMGVPPVLSLIRGGAVVGSLALDEEFNENVGAILKDIYRPKPEQPAGVRFKRWVRKHKFYTALIIILLLPIAYTLGQGIFYSIASSFG